MSDNRKAPIDILNEAFAPRDKNSYIQKDGLTHPHSEEIIKGVKRILSYSATGQDLLAFLDHFEEIKVKIIKDAKQSGFIPNSDLALVTCPATQTKVTPKTVIQFIRAVREAEQEKGGLPRPTLQMSEEDYIQRDIKKQEDIFVTQFYIAWELKKNMDIEDLINALRAEDGMKEAVDRYINYMVTNNL